MLGMLIPTNLGTAMVCCQCQYQSTIFNAAKTA